MTTRGWWASHGVPAVLMRRRDAMIRVLVVDDHPAFRSGLRAVLDADDVITVVGEASSGEEALERAVALMPDVVLMDLLMPGIGGIAATERLVATMDCRVVVISMGDGDAAIVAALRAGARGYLLKDAPAADIVSAVRAAAAGNAVLGGAVAAGLGALLGRSAAPDLRPFPQLSERERGVLELIAQGRPNPEIARRLSLSDKTVRNYSSGIFAKLGARSRAEAVAIARNAGLGDVPPTS